MTFEHSIGQIFLTIDDVIQIINNLDIKQRISWAKIKNVSIKHSQIKTSIRFIIQIILRTLSHTFVKHEDFFHHKCKHRHRLPCNKFRLFTLNYKIKELKSTLIRTLTKCQWSLTLRSRKSSRFESETVLCDIE